MTDIIALQPFYRKVPISTSHIFLQPEEDIAAILFSIKKEDQPTLFFRFILPFPAIPL